jgi:LPS-assembly protein
VSAAESLSASGEEQNEPASIRAQVMHADQSSSMMYGDGDVVITYQDTTLTADHVRYNKATKETWATGNVRLNQEGQEWAAPAGYYNFETRALKTDHVRGYFDPVYFTAEHLESVSSNHYHAVKIALTTCPYGKPDFHVEASHGDIYPGDRIALYNVVGYVGQVPCCWFPIMIWSLKGGAQPFMISIGDSSQSGFFILTTTYLRLNNNSRVGVELDERTARGFGSGMEYDYNWGKAAQGMLRWYYINDAAPETSSNLVPKAQEIIPSNRYRVEWQHKDELTNNVSVTVDLQQQSDAAVIHDFFSAEFGRQNQPESVADITKRGENYTISGMLQPQLNPYFAEVERLPEVKLATDRTRLWSTPLFYEGETSAGYYDNVQGSFTNDSLFVGRAFRFDTFHQLVLPQFYFGWLSIVPRAGGRYTYYGDSPDTASTTNDLKRFVGDLGAEASFKMSRTWDNVQFQPLGVNGLRHILQPFVDYQWVPAPNVNSNQLFQFDTIRTTSPTFATNASAQAFSVTRWEPLDFPAFDSVDAITKEDTVRFGLDQKLQTLREGKPWDLVELEGWTDFHAEENPGEKIFSEFFGTLRLKPTQWIAMDAFTRYDMLTGQLLELNTEARIQNNDRWSIGIGTRYLQDDSNLISVEVAWRLSRLWTAQMYQRFDSQTGTWEEQSYMLRQETHDWYVGYGFRYVNDLNYGHDLAAFVSLTLKAYPSVEVGANGIDLGAGE